MSSLPFTTRTNGGDFCFPKSFEKVVRQFLSSHIPELSKVHASTALEPNFSVEIKFLPQRVSDMCSFITFLVMDLFANQKSLRV